MYPLILLLAPLQLSWSPRLSSWSSCWSASLSSWSWSLWLWSRSSSWSSSTLYLNPVIAHPPLTNSSPPFPDESDAASRGEEGLANLETEGKEWMKHDWIIDHIDKEARRYEIWLQRSHLAESWASLCNSSQINGLQKMQSWERNKFTISKLQIANQVMISINLQKREEVVKSFCWK